MSESTLVSTPSDALELPSRRHEVGVVVGLYAVSILGALALSALLVSLTGGSSRAVFSALIEGSVGSPGAWGRTLVQTAPLLIVAVGTMVATRAGMVNIGQEGQLLIGAAFAAFFANRLPGPGPMALLLALAFGVLGGALWAGIAAVLRLTRKIPEVISSLLLVFVAFQVVTYGLTRKGLLLDRDPENITRLNVGEQLAPDTRLPFASVFGNSFHLGVLLALALALLVAFLLARTVWGFRLQMLGKNARAAHRAGVSPARAGVALAVSGAFAGLAGAMMLTGGAANHRLTLGFSNNVGWEGLLVALLSRDRPLLTIPMAFVFAALRTGAGFLATTGVERKIVDVVQALLVLALLIPPALLAIRDRRRALAGAAGSA